MKDENALSYCLEELRKLEKEEYAICAVLGKLQTFIESASRASNLEDVWSHWTSSLHLGNKLKCWEINKCAKYECEAYKTEQRCWLLEKTPCQNGCTTYSEKIRGCFRCKVIDELRKDTPVFLNEIINILIKFLTLRDKELISIAIRDGLTKVYNRFYFDEYIQHETLMAERHDDCIAFILVDVDDFKTINDKFGHAIGDNVLYNLASILAKAVRTMDMVFRIGGDEFLIVLPRTKCDEIENIMQRIYFNISEWNKHQSVNVSISMGCSTWHKGDVVSEKIDEADKNMYKAKREKK